jgi:SAM-dependent methyltransferase
MATPRRLVFGEVADLYDRHRPAYPPALIDDLLAGAGLRDGHRVLEVGAGTGKATAMVAARGVRVLAIEPSPSMAAIARRNCGADPNVEIVESDFEQWDSGGERFPLLYAAQAWHWIDPQRKYGLARRALIPGGLLAAFWNRAAWDSTELRNALIAVYERLVPDMPTDGPMHPANPAPGADEDDWAAELAGVSGFDDLTRRSYRWGQQYTATEFAGLLATLSETRLLDPEVRGRLLATVSDTVAAHGATMTMPIVTYLHTARAA